MVRQLKIAGGIILLIAGGILALPGVPGPGIPIFIAGLIILSPHFAWARKTLEWIKRRIKPRAAQEVKS